MGFNCPDNGSAHSFRISSWLVLIEILLRRGLSGLAPAWSRQDGFTHLDLCVRVRMSTHTHTYTSEGFARSRPQQASSSEEAFARFDVSHGFLCLKHSNIEVTTRYTGASVPPGRPGPTQESPTCPFERWSHCRARRERHPMSRCFNYHCVSCLPTPIAFRTAVPRRACSELTADREPTPLPPKPISGRVAREKSAPGFLVTQAPAENAAQG